MMGRRNDLGEWDRSCLACGEVFFYDQKAGNSPDYCSNACKQRAYRRRKRQQQPRIEFKVKINANTQSVIMIAEGETYFMSADEAGVLAERLYKARSLLTAQQTTF